MTKSPEIYLILLLKLIDLYYHPHHISPEDSSSTILEKFEKVLIIDCHSYPKTALPYEEPGLYRPEICIGFDNCHSDPVLVKRYKEHFENLGLEVGINTPFSGPIVPSRF